MWEGIVAVIGLVGSAAGAIWAAYVGTRRRVLAELEGRYDADLRTERLKVYPKLWASLEPLAKYARESPRLPTKIELEHLADALRRWYFRDGGLYLSADSREAYFQLQDVLAALTSRDDEVDRDTFEALRKVASWLRTALTYDVGTRRRFAFAPDAEEAPDDREAKREAQRLAEGLRARSPAPSDRRPPAA